MEKNIQTWWIWSQKCSCHVDGEWAKENLKNTFILSAYLWGKKLNSYFFILTVLLSTQGIPSTCQGTFSYTLKKVSYRENASGENVTELLCSNTTCSVDVTEDAHSINLTVLLNEAVLAEDSVYVPATTESEWKCLLFMEPLTPLSVEQHFSLWWSDFTFTWQVSLNLLKSNLQPRTVSFLSDGRLLFSPSVATWSTGPRMELILTGRRPNTQTWHSEVSQWVFDRQRGLGKYLMFIGRVSGADDGVWVITSSYEGTELARSADRSICVLSLLMVQAWPMMETMVEGCAVMHLPELYPLTQTLTSQWSENCCPSLSLQFFIFIYEFLHQNIYLPLFQTLTAEQTHMVQFSTVYKEDHLLTYDIRPSLVNSI